MNMAMWGTAHPLLVLGLLQRAPARRTRPGRQTGVAGNGSSRIEPQRDVVLQQQRPGEIAAGRHIYGAAARQSTIVNRTLDGGVQGLAVTVRASAADIAAMRRLLESADGGAADE